MIKIPAQQRRIRLSKPMEYKKKLEKKTWGFSQITCEECYEKSFILEQNEKKENTYLPWQYINIAIFGSRAWIHDPSWVYKSYRKVGFPRCHTCTALRGAKKGLGVWVKVDTLGVLRRNIMCATLQVIIKNHRSWLSLKKRCIFFKCANWSTTGKACIKGDGLEVEISDKYVKINFLKRCVVLITWFLRHNLNVEGDKKHWVFV